MNRDTWPRARLGDHVDLLSGFPFKSVRFTKEPGDIPLVKGENLHQGFIDWNKAKRWPIADAEQYDKFKLAVGDVVIAMDRPWIDAGLKHAWIQQKDPESLLVQRVARLRGTNGLSTEYLKFVIGGPAFTNYIRPIVTGVNVPHISGKQIREFVFSIPPKQVQYRIAAILSAYDDLTENNTRRIQILEEIARAMYREWFVNFRFSGHENVKMVDSEAGLIPEGWEVKPLGEACKIVMGQSPKSEYYNQTGDGLPFHQGVTDFGRFFPTDRIYCTLPNRVAERGDILFSVRAPVGRINVANKKIVIGRGLCAIQSKDGVQTFILYQLKDQFKEEDMIGGGTIFQAVTKGDMLGIKMLRPLPEVTRRFEDMAGSNLSEIEMLSRKNFNLRQTRDLLLPRLVSGEVDVSELDITVEGLAQ